MQISIVGECDKRPFTYTLLDICQFLGDVLFVTEDESYAQFAEEIETQNGVKLCYYGNIVIAISKYKTDDLLHQAGYDTKSFDYIIYDNQIDASGAAIIYICTGEMSDLENDLLAFISESDMIVINYGQGRHAVHMNSKVEARCDEMEERKDLRIASSEIGGRIFKIISDITGLPVKTLKKAVR